MERILSIPKALLVGAVILFSSIGILGIFKKGKEKGGIASERVESFKENSIPLKSFTESPSSAVIQEVGNKKLDNVPLPTIDRVFQLFTTGPSKLPIVETVEYKSSVPWLKGRPAWLADYAVYYNTSKHFISRSLSGKLEYFSQKVSSGSQFNVFKQDKKVEFHLVVDTTHCRLAFYYVDLDTHERVLLKVYHVGLGRIDVDSPSGTLTPYGSYQLGDKVAVYQPGVTGLFHDQKTEMVRVFGSRWIPLGQEIEGCSEPGKGYGIQGAPWIVDSESGELVENRACIGRYETDGCIRLFKEDIEEIYAIVVTKPSFIHISKHLDSVKLPGIEVATPSR